MNLEGSNGVLAVAALLLGALVVVFLLRPRPKEDWMEQAAKDYLF